VSGKRRKKARRLWLFKRIPELTSDEIRRFWSQVEQPSQNSCWLWHGPTRTSHGCKYGVFHIFREGRKRGFFREGHKQGFYAHRVAYWLIHRKLDNGLTIDHSCVVPLCMNAAGHMEQVTQSVNSKRIYERRADRLTCKNGHPKTERAAPCAVCRREYAKRWRERHPERAKAQQRKYYFRGGGRAKRLARDAAFRAEWRGERGRPGENPRQD